MPTGRELGENGFECMHACIFAWMHASMHAGIQTHTDTYIHTYILPSHDHKSAAPTVRDGPRDHRCRLVSSSDGAVRLAGAALPYPAQLLQWLVFVRDPGLGYEGPESDRGRCLRLRLRLPYCQSDWFWTWVAPDAFAVVTHARGPHLLRAVTPRPPSGSPTAARRRPSSTPRTPRATACRAAPRPGRARRPLRPPRRRPRRRPRRGLARSPLRRLPPA